MIFELRPLSDIKNEEIVALVEEHRKEQQHLEFKVTVDLKDDKDRLEVLRDVASLANGGGGYLIVGIRDDGSGKAQKFEPTLVGDTKKICQSMRSLCMDKIRERILNLELECRTVEGNPIVIVRVPQSDRTPHMVSFNHRTDFVSRYEDGKREMTLAEIREAFVGDKLTRHLASIESSLNRLQVGKIDEDRQARALEAAKSGSTTPLLTNESGKVLSEAYRERFNHYVEDKPFFSVSAVPENPNANFLDTHSEGILNLIQDPPKSRWAGWDMNFGHFPTENVSFGVQRGRDDFRLVEIWRNGFVQLRAQIDSQFCWGQKEEEFERQPCFNPVTISEYVVAFLRFYSALLEICDDTQSAFFNLQYRNIRGFRIRPRTWFHDLSKEYLEEHLELPDVKLEPGFNPETTGFAIMRDVFSMFGLEPQEIPAWNGADQTFEFEKLK